MESEPLPGTSTRGIRQLQDDGGAQAGQGQRAQTENGCHYPKEKVRQRMQGCVIYKLHVLDACREIVIFYFKFFFKKSNFAGWVKWTIYPNHHKDIFNWEIVFF